MKYQALFFFEKHNWKIKMSSAAFVIRALSVKDNKVNYGML